MWPDRVSNPGPPTYESGALPIALRGPASLCRKLFTEHNSLGRKQEIMEAKYEEQSLQEA